MPLKQVGENFYYDNTEIKKAKAYYNMVIGEMSDGKTFAALEEIIKGYCDTYNNDVPNCGAIIRRYDKDFTGLTAVNYFKPLVDAGKLKDTPFDDIQYYRQAWYMVKYEYEVNKKGEELITPRKEKKPFCYAFPINTMEHTKGPGYKECTTIVFDEFLTRSVYLVNEYDLFQQVVSRIVRDDCRATIWMLGNTVTWNNPYFREMGLTKSLRDMEQGDIVTVKYHSDPKVNQLAVEYVPTIDRKVCKKKSDVYFDFENNGMGKMITTGQFMMAMYPHLPTKYVPNEVLFTYYIAHDDRLYQCDIVELDEDSSRFTYIYELDEAIDDDDSLIFSDTNNVKSNWRKSITKPFDNLGKKIYDFYQKDKVYYQDNMVGESINNYLKFCRSYNIIRA